MVHPRGLDRKPETPKEFRGDSQTDYVDQARKEANRDLTGIRKSKRTARRQRRSFSQR